MPRPVATAAAAAGGAIAFLLLGVSHAFMPMQVSQCQSGSVQVPQGSRSERASPCTASSSPRAASPWRLAGSLSQGPGQGFALRMAEAEGGEGVGGEKSVAEVAPVLSLEDDEEVEQGEAEWPYYLRDATEEELANMTAEEEDLYYKKKQADKLRQEERFIVKETGDWECQGCTYLYTKNNMRSFDDLPDTWSCPNCGAKKSEFRAETVTIAGFEVNQGYGFGGNQLTGGQKNGLIFGGLALFFVLFLGGYALE